ncbi:catalytic subunit of glutamate-cysteine ligase [Chytridium lagenaria]|nr:catalytic subunit of glutamate-cysteine ligase [Chytridium lagenaria]
MGLLSLGTPMKWEEARQHAGHVRKHGITQFSNIWRRIKTRRNDHLYWGDEVEYIVVHLDDSTKTARVSLGAYEALQKLENMERAAIDANGSFESSWKPEYGRYMLEGTPGAPYGSTLQDLLTVEPNMIQRRKLAQSVLGENEALITVTNFPRLGCVDFVFPSHAPTPDAAEGSSRSLFVSDEAINPHPRFRTLTANIRQRRGSKVAINMPVYKDVKTPSPFLEPAPSILRNQSMDLKAALTPGGLPEDKAASLDHSSLPPLPEIAPDAKPDHIYMDCMCFGMGCCCLQVTFQACSVEEARRLYDHLAVVTPIMMALSAASPIFRGYLADVDCRWDVISGSVDDRTKEERGESPLKDSRFAIPKSRYASISRYLSTGPNYSGGCCSVKEGEDIQSYYKPKYNDIPLVHDKDIYAELLENGVDDELAKHYAHLFIHHFENIQSTNWQTMRFNPRRPLRILGWRVEFRSMEIQMTDFENAAFSIFVVLLTRTILSFRSEPVDENMKTAMKRDAVLKEKFWFRRNINAVSADKINEDDDACDYVSLDHIINGNVRHLTSKLNPRLSGAYLTSAAIPHATFSALNSYLDLISRRASGALPTTARWIRNFVDAHPEYKKDSVVSEEINWDLMKEVIACGNSEGRVKGLSI